MLMHQVDLGQLAPRVNIATWLGACHESDHRLRGAGRKSCESARRDGDTIQLGPTILDARGWAQRGGVGQRTDQMSRWRVRSGLTVLGIFAAWLAAGPAAAEPATTVLFPASASATRFSGSAFDTCSAPSVATLQAWTASPFDAVGAYIGGINRSCAQPNLTASWVTSVSRARWRIIPIYLGLQPPCSTRPHKFTAATAVSAGTANASDAVKQAKAVGILPGSAIYGDVENYNAADSSCRNAALAYVSAWTKELHRAGYLSGVYANLSSGAKQLSDV